MLGLGSGDGEERRRSLFAPRTAPAKPPAPPPVTLDSNSEALLILRTYEEGGQGWFWATDANGCLTYISDAIGSQFADNARLLLGKPLTDLLVSCDEGGATQRTLAFVLARRTRFSKLYVERSSAVESTCWELSGAPFFDDEGQFRGFRGSGLDVTEQRNSSRQASQLAMYDPLTGLANRRRMLHTLVSTLRAFAVADRACAVMLLDLDRFKHVNDTLGHPAGDALLKQVAERLLTIVPDREYVCRLGGDEFQITLPDVSDRGILGELASRIIGILSQPYLIEGTRCVIGASVGIAVSPVDGGESDELIRNADLALYAAKGAGRGRYRFFSSEFLEAAEDRRRLEEDLRDAVAREELTLYYQPIVSAATDCVTGVEALCRWNHPTRGWVSPGVFIPIAEEANIIEDIGRWALRQACLDAVKWPGELRVAVNLSPIQFSNDELPTVVSAALAASGLAPDRLELELTEGIFLASTTHADQMFEALKALGVRLALDDFGTGYSSLGYLRKAPFDKIKIDQSFVRGTLEEGARNAAIIAAIVALADALGMETTAEGLETHDQLALIRSLKVSHVQGYIYSKAVPSATVAEHVAQGTWRIPPMGPAKQRYERQTVFRKAGAIHDDHCYPIIIRNISQSGALMQGLLDVPVGTEFVLDLGDGQFVVATVRRSDGDLQGVEFEQQLVPDGNGGLCTRHRVSSYMLSMAGHRSVHEAGAGRDITRAGSLPVFRTANEWTAAKRLAA